MTSGAVRGASVGELLDQANEHLYDIAVNPPAAANLLAAWPDYQRACLLLLSAAIGPRVTAVASHGAHEPDPVVCAGLQLHALLSARQPPGWPTVPDARLVRAGQLIGAAADLIQCAHDRPGAAQRDAVQADTSRRAGVVRAAELALTAADLTVRACGRPSDKVIGRGWTSARLTARAAPLFETRRAAAVVLDGPNPRPGATQLDEVRALPPSVPAGDLLGRLEAAISVWTTASLGVVRQPAISTAELQRSTVESRHLIALTAAITHAAGVAGILEATDASDTVARLRRAGFAWSTATTAWTHFTTGVRPGEQHVQASLELQAALRSVGRGRGGQWLSPGGLTARVPLQEALALTRDGTRDLGDVARAHKDAATQLAGLGRLYAPATSLSPAEHRVTDRLQRRHVIVTPAEAISLSHAYNSVAIASQEVSSSLAYSHRGATTACRHEQAPKAAVRQSAR